MEKVTLGGWFYVYVLIIHTSTEKGELELDKLNSKCFVDWGHLFAKNTTWKKKEKKRLICQLGTTFLADFRQV